MTVAAMMALATPAMLPVPIVPAKAVDTAWKGLIPPLLSRWPEKRPPKVLRKTSPMRRSWKKPLPTVKYRPMPNKRATIQGPHTKSSSHWYQFI